ncbi:hypothetical protein ARMGADRAFT_1089325 [Armillaria gallica]|uniref:Uncharacterized protein n=1 Tax=Armillaria gallica TaxID=47427 RepID=A0A2H3CWA5_ARMGA|nr:hypothetical protein ARMGADRAFT_1089325 [Armillaria gallica]
MARRCLISLAFSDECESDVCEELKKIARVVLRLLSFIARSHSACLFRMVRGAVANLWDVFVLFCGDVKRENNYEDLARKIASAAGLESHLQEKGENDGDNYRVFLEYARIISTYRVVMNNEGSRATRGAEVKLRHQTDMMCGGDHDSRIDEDIFIMDVNVLSPTPNTDPVHDTEPKGPGLPDNQNLISSHGTGDSSMKSATIPEKEISVKDPVTAGARSDSVALLLQPSTPMVVDLSPPSPPMDTPERLHPFNMTDALSYLFGCVLPVILSAGATLAKYQPIIEALQLALMRRFDKLVGSNNVPPPIYGTFHAYLRR